MLEFVILDVSELAPPEPMTQILQALAKLSADQCLRVEHRRQPFPLYEKLVQTGWGYHCDQASDNRITLYIFKQENQSHFDSLRLGSVPIDKIP